jgi:chloramphenicol-sensitive protein RarD
MDDVDMRGLRAAVLAYTSWGLLTLYWKQLVGLDAVEMIGWRVATAAALMAVVVVATRRHTDILAALRSRSTGPRIVLAALLLVGNWTTYVWAVVNDRVLETALGYFLAPLGTMTLGVVVLGERLTPLKRATIALAVAAVVVLTVSYGRLPWVSLVLAGSWSWYGLTKRRVPLGPVESLSAELAVVALPAVALIASGFVRPGGIPDQAVGTDWLWLLGTGAVTAFPLLLFAYAAKRLPFTVLGPANYLVPLINFLLGWLVFDEALTASRVVGFVLVWIALALVTVDMVRGRPARSAPTPVPVR